jgi:uncharacterized protein
MNARESCARTVVVRETGLRCELADGTVLVADAWHPAGDGRWPALLQRLPYGRSVASSPVLPHPEWFARRGYSVVVQDCRGRGDSTGTFAPFVHEGPDGAEAIEWAARLPFADGRVATYGFSYQGLNQLYAAARRPPSLRAIAPMMCCPDPYEGWTYEGGLRRWPFVCFWAAQLAGQAVGAGPIPFDPGVLPLAAALGDSPPPWFVEWLDHPTDDDYWAARRPALDAIDVPAFTVGGWFDDFASGTARIAERLGAETWFGPWAHMPWGTRHGGVDLGHEASPAPAWEALAGFFDRVFAGDADRRPSARFYVLGEGWREAPSWPPPVATARWCGRSATGNAASRWGDGVLGPAATSAPADVPSAIVVEPHAPHPGGPPDHDDDGAAHDRRDIACFTSSVLTAPLVLAGAPVVWLRTTCDRPRHDVVVTLTVVDDRAGTARVVTSGARRAVAAAPWTERTWELVLRPVAVRVEPGLRLRLAVSGARFPCFDRNPHVEADDPDTPADGHRVATVAVWDVAVDLPVVSADEDRPIEGFERQKEEPCGF